VAAAPVSRADLRFDTVRITAWTYAVYCVTLCPVAMLDGPERRSLTEVIVTLVILVSLAAAILSATRRKRIGYYFCFILSVLLLPAAGVGTVLGWNMLRALRKNRRQFWPYEPRPPWMKDIDRSKHTAP
jgi:hypothetical protein